MTITLRQTKGSALTHAELDRNFIDLAGQLDGITWESQTNPVDNTWNGITYGNGLFVATSSSGTGNRAMTSPDGVNWTIRTSAADNPWVDVAYGDGIFVAVSNSGATRVMTSYDGITWTLRVPPGISGWTSIVYGNGLFVAVGSNATLNDCMTSPDGITWTIQTVPLARSWQSVTYGNGLYVAVAATGTGDRVMTSPDGVTWTSRTSAADYQWLGIIYGNGLFVAVAGIGAGTATNRIMTSPDGITWTARTTPLTTPYNSVTYGNGVFVAVGSDGSGGNENVLTSPDGIVWTARNGAAPNLWANVHYGNGMFVAVSANGTSDRVMTSGFTHETIVEDTHRVNGEMIVYGTPGLSVLGDDFIDQNIFLGSTTNLTAAFVKWQYNNNFLQIGTNGSESAIEFYTDVSELAATLTGSGRLGIGTPTPDGKLHVHTASAGAVTASTLADDLIIENDTHGGLTILTPDAGIGAIYFGNDSSNLNAVVQWRRNITEMLIGTSIAGGYIRFNIANVTAGMFLAADGGLYMVGATGSSQGAGTINATELYASQTAGIGTNAPDGTLHVHTATAGTITAHIDADDLTVENSANAGITILSPDAANSSIHFGSPTDNLGSILQWNYSGSIFTIGTSKVGANFNLISGNSVTAMTIASDQGAFMTGATGGSQGSGTFNAVGVYDDGVLLTCYVPHYIVDGKIDLSEWDGFVPNKEELKTFHEPARQFVKDVDNRVDVNKFTNFWKTNKHLPTMPSKEEWIEDGPLPTGKMVQKLWETVELQAAHIDQLLTRIEALEKVA